MYILEVFICISLISHSAHSYHDDEGAPPKGQQRIFFSPDQVTYGGSDPDKEVSKSADIPNVPPEKIPPAKVEKGIHILLDLNFFSFIGNHSIVFVKFYAPWCHHCLNFASDFEKLSAEMENHEPKVVFAKVNVESEKHLKESYSEELPTLRLFIDGEVIKFKGGRTLEELMTFLKKHANVNRKPTVSRILHLSEDNFTATLNQYPMILVDFYAPWCSHCRKIAIDLENAARRLYNRNPNMRIAYIDAVANKNLSDLYKITEYPSVKLFRRSRPISYTGKRDEDGIVNYMVENFNISAPVVNSMSDIKTVWLKKEVTNFLLGGFESKEDSLFYIFEETAFDLKDKYLSAVTFNKDLMARFNMPTNSFVVITSELFRSEYEPEYYVYDKSVSEATSASIEEFVESKKVPLLGQYGDYTAEYYDKVKESTTPICFFFYAIDWSPELRKGLQSIRKKILDVVHEFKGDIVSCMIDEIHHSTRFKNYDLDESPEDINIGCNVKNKRYALKPYMEEWNPKTVRKFMKGVLDDTARRVFHTQAIPRDNDKPVKIIVARNFVEMVEDPVDKDVFIFFHTVNCKKCPPFMKIYEKLAAKLVDQEPNLVLAKMDLSHNGHRDPPYSMRGVPTFYLSPAFSKRNPFRWEGDLNEDDLLEFLTENCRNSFKKSKKQKEDL